MYKGLLREIVEKLGISKDVLDVDSEIVDDFVRNAHGLVLVRGTRWGEFARNKVALGTFDSVTFFSHE